MSFYTYCVGLITTDMASNSAGSLKKLGFTSIWVLGDVDNKTPLPYVGVYPMKSPGGRRIAVGSKQGEESIHFRICSKTIDAIYPVSDRIKAVLEGQHTDPTGGRALSDGIQPDPLGWRNFGDPDIDYPEFGYHFADLFFVQSDFRP